MIKCIIYVRLLGGYNTWFRQPTLSSVSVPLAPLYGNLWVLATLGHVKPRNSKTRDLRTVRVHTWYYHQTAVPPRTEKQLLKGPPGFCHTKYITNTGYQGSRGVCPIIITTITVSWFAYWPNNCVLPYFLMCFAERRKMSTAEFCSCVRETEMKEPGTSILSHTPSLGAQRSKGNLVLRKSYLDQLNKLFIVSYTNPAGKDLNSIHNKQTIYKKSTICFKCIKEQLVPCEEKRLWRKFL